MTRIYKRPQRHTIYWALQDTRKWEKRLGKPCAYRHVKRDLNTVADDMTRRAHDSKDTVVYWDGNLPEDAPPNQMADVYASQGVKPQLDWTNLPKPLDLDPPTLLATFSAPLATRAMLKLH